jgi:hypothetical protein
MAAPLARRQRTNPFYVVLVAAGIAFFVTASAYGMMAFRADRRGRSLYTSAADDGPRVASPDNSPLLSFLERRGGWLMAGELAVLAIASLAAMGTDRFFGGEPTSMETNRNSTQKGDA